MATLNDQLKSAAKRSDLAEMQRLVTAGADVNNTDDGYTPMVWAVVDGKLAAVKWLLDHGAEPDRRGKNGWTPLMSAASGDCAEIARLLLDRGASAVIRSSEGKNAIDIADEKGNSALVLMLRETPDEVVFSDTVLDRTLQEVYSFRRRERFTFLRKGETGAIEAMQRDKFSDIAGESGLRRAFEEHRKRGGKLTEDEVFDTPPVKPKLSLPLGR